MIRQGWLYKLRKNLSKRGLAGTFKVAFFKAVTVARDLRPRIRKWRADQVRFDRSHGIFTEAVVLPEDLDIPSPNAVHGKPYNATAVGHFQEALGQLRIDLADYIFIDIGSGMGRVLFMASDHPFRRIQGVEYSPDLHEQAVKNLRTYRSGTQRSRNIELLCMDAAEFEFPPENSVIYIANPFGKPVMERVIANLERSLRENPRKLIVMYHYPLVAELFDQARFLQPISRSPLWAFYSAV